MPLAKAVLNGFTAAEVSKITGLSVPMIDYLLRMGFMRPAYTSGRRGRVRYYSYRDLVAARLVQRLREAGVELSRLKYAVRKLSLELSWTNERDPVDRLKWLVSDASRHYWRKQRAGHLDDRLVFAIRAEFARLTDPDASLGAPGLFR